MSEPAILPSRASYTQIACFQRCKFRFWLKYVKGVQQRGKGMGLLKGTLLHEAYDRYLFLGRSSHKVAYDHLLTIAEKEVANGVEVSQADQALEEATEVLSYFLPWSDKNDNFQVVIPEGQQQCETSGNLPIKLKDGSIKEIFFKIDEIIMVNGQLGMMENKFRKSIDSTGLEHDLQITIYQAAWNQLHQKPEQKLNFVLYNIVGTKPPKTGKNAGQIAARTTMYRGEGEQKRALGNVAAVLYDMKRTAQDELQVWPLNPTKECSWDCDFVGLCMGVRAGASLQEYLDSGQYYLKGNEPKPQAAESKDEVDGFSMIE